MTPIAFLSNPNSCLNLPVRQKQSARRGHPLNRPPFEHSPLSETSASVAGRSSSGGITMSGGSGSGSRGSWALDLERAEREEEARDGLGGVAMAWLLLGTASGNEWKGAGAERVEWANLDCLGSCLCPGSRQEEKNAQRTWERFDASAFARRGSPVSAYGELFAVQTKSDNKRMI